MQQLQRGWLVTSEHENNAPFPKPWGPRTGEGGVGWGLLGGKTSPAILQWFTVTASHTNSPLPSLCGRRGGKRRREKEEVGSDRYSTTVYSSENPGLCSLT